MCTISNIICFLFLLYLSWSDGKERKVSAGVLAAAGLTAFLYQVLIEARDVRWIIGGILPGAVFILISKLTEEGIGYGDSLGILCLGIYLGFWQVLSVLMCAFFLLFCVLIPVLVKKKMSRKAGLAFYPFLTGGVLWVLLMGG